MIQTSWIEVSKSALLHNADFFHQLSPRQALFAVIKGNAYGHGQNLVVKVLEKSRAVYGYQVFDFDEAVAVRQQSRKPIAILGHMPLTNTNLHQAASNNLTIPIIDLISARKVIAAKIKVSVQVKVDIGTHRIGTAPEEALRIINTLSKHPSITIDSVYAHLADSENNDESLTKKQIRSFQKFLHHVTATGLAIPHSTLACSAAIAKRYAPEIPAVRLGLGLYGLSPLDDNNLQQKIKPVLSWKTNVMQTRLVKAGEYIGYARRYRSPRNAWIATIPVGYYDGLSRALSNRGRLLINGKFRSIRGNVCMNMTMLEVDSKTRAGDEVVLIGQQQRRYNSATELAQSAGTINYEIVTRLQPYIKRVLVL